MKNIILAAAALMTLGGIASAADLPVKAPAPVAVRPACAQFGGFYIGGQLGWAYYDHTWKDHDAWSAEDDTRMLRSNLNITKDGFIGGVQGGYNWQRGCTVFGVEADYSWSSIKASTFETDGEHGDDLDTLTVTSRLKGLGTLRARTGIVVDNLMLYVTGGVAVANFNRSYTLTTLDPDATETFEYSTHRWGWTAGVGTEWAFANNWTIKSEVLYARFNKDDRTFTCANPVFCTDGPESKRFGHQDNVWVSRVGLNYRFGGGGAWGW